MIFMISPVSVRHPDITIYNPRFLTPDLSQYFCPIKVPSYDLTTFSVNHPDTVSIVVDRVYSLFDYVGTPYDTDDSSSDPNNQQTPVSSPTIRVLMSSLDTPIPWLRGHRFRYDVSLLTQISTVSTVTVRQLLQQDPTGIIRNLYALWRASALVVDESDVLWNQLYMGLANILEIPVILIATSTCRVPEAAVTVDVIVKNVFAAVHIAERSGSVSYIDRLIAIAGANTANTIDETAPVTADRVGGN